MTTNAFFGYGNQAAVGDMVEVIFHTQGRDYSEGVYVITGIDRHTYSSQVTMRRPSVSQLNEVTTVPSNSEHWGYWWRSFRKITLSAHTPPAKAVSYTKDILTGLYAGLRAMWRFIRRNIDVLWPIEMFMIWGVLFLILIHIYQH